MNGTLLENIPKSAEKAEFDRILMIWRADRPKAELEIAYWFVRILPQLQFKMFPSRTREYHEYKIAVWAVKKAMRENTDLWVKIKHYLDTFSSIKRDNESNLYWLKQARDWLPEGDFENREKLQSRIDEIAAKLSGIDA